MQNDWQISSCSSHCTSNVLILGMKWKKCSIKRRTGIHWVLVVQIWLDQNIYIIRMKDEGNVIQRKEFCFEKGISIWSNNFYFPNEIRIFKKYSHNIFNGVFFWEMLFVLIDCWAKRLVNESWCKSTMFIMLNVHNRSITNIQGSFCINFHPILELFITFCATFLNEMITRSFL